MSALTQITLTGKRGSAVAGASPSSRGLAELLTPIGATSIFWVSSAAISCLAASPTPSTALK